MLSRFLRDGAVYGAAGILARGISFFLLPLYTHALAPADYGAVDMLTLLVSLANLSVALEISQGLARFYPAAPTEEARRAYASSALWFTVATFALFWAIGAVAAPLLSVLLLDSPAGTTLVHVALAAACANGVFYLAQNQLRWQLQPGRYAAASLVTTVVTAALSFPLLLWLRLGALGVVLAQLAGSTMGAVVGLVLARRSYAFTFDRARCREMLAFSLPLVPASLAVFVALYVDRIAIKHYMTLEEVGVFGVAVRLCSIVGLLMIGVQGALTPLVYAHHTEPETPANLARIFRVFVASALLLGLALTAFAPELLSIVAAPAYAPAAQVIPLLTPAVLLAGMYVFAPGLALAKRTGLIAGLTIAGALVNVALNVALVPRLGTRGAALATLIGGALVFSGYMILSQRLYPAPHRWRPLAAGTLLVLVAAAAATRLPDGSAAGVAAKLALVFVTAVVLLELGLVRTDEIRRAGEAVLRHVRGPGGRGRPATGAATAAPLE